MLTFNNIFYEIATILAITTVTGGLAVWLRQPLIMAFIAVGVLVGPAGLKLLASGEQVDLFAQLGIALLLFVVGLKLDLQEIKAVGPVALTAGIGQILITGCLGYLITLALGFEGISGFYIGIALAFSSTIIVVKLLSDKREIDALHGRIALGVLIVQDIVVVLVMIGLTAFDGNSQGADLGWSILLVFLKGSGFLLLVAIITRYLLPKLLNSLARSTELLLIFAISWAIALASIGDVLGFSQEVGAFIGGVSLASTSYRPILGAKLASIRDFLLLFFFIDLGIHINIAYLGSEIVPALALSAFVLMAKPLMLTILVGMMGYRKYTSTITSLSLSQISEFSLILATLGVELGQITEEVLGLITLVGLITMGVSTYAIIYSHELYARFSNWLFWFDLLIPHPKQYLGDLAEAYIPPVDVILFGLGRYGGSMIRDLQHQGLRVLGIDFDPELVQFWQGEGVIAFYGDAEDLEFTGALPLSEAKWVVSTLPGVRSGLALLHNLEHRCFQGKIALTSHNVREMKILSDAGADLVLLPFRDAAKEAARQLVS